MSESLFNRVRERGRGVLTNKEMSDHEDASESEVDGFSLFQRWRQRGQEALNAEQQAAQERKEKIGGSLAGSTFAALGAGGLGAGVLLGEALKMAMKVDFDAHGINAANEDATKMFSKGYDWAYGKKKAA